MQLKIIKSDGSVEEYLHTKVIGTFNNALSLIGQSNVYAAEQFAEAITYYLYQKNTDQTITSDQIHLMIQAVLAATGYQNAAKALNEYHLQRRINRKRIEVIDDLEHPEIDSQCRWDKSRIVQYLMNRQHLDYHLSRAIATTVEDKVLKLGFTQIPRNLIRQLVSIEMHNMLQAHEQLQAIGQ